MRIVTLLVLGATAAVTGCAALAPNDDDRVDNHKVSTVDRQARLRGIEVHWVNFPQRKPEPASAVPTAPPAVPPTGT